MAKLKIKDSILNHFIQFIFIFSSVYFAFWLTNLGEINRVKEIEEKAITALYLEIKENSEQLKTAYNFHGPLLDYLDVYNDSIAEGLIDPSSLKPLEHLQKIFTRNSSSLGMANIKRNAWIMLQNSDAYVNVDFELASMLGQLYTIQSSGVEATSGRIAQEIFGADEMFKEEESEAILLMSFWAMRELEGQEQYLHVMTRKTMEDMEAAYPFLKAL